jgi:hypothetical protein
MFLLCSHADHARLPTMAHDLSKLRSASDDDIKQCIAHGLLFRGRKRTHDFDHRLADIAASVLLEHLMRSGFVILKKPEAPPFSAPYPYAPKPE